MSDPANLAEFFAVAVMAAVALALMFATLPDRENWSKTGWGLAMALEAILRGVTLKYPAVLADFLVPADTIHYFVACGFFVAAAAGRKRHAHAWIASALAISATGAIASASLPHLAALFGPAALALASLAAWRWRWSAMTIVALSMIAWAGLAAARKTGLVAEFSPGEMALATSLLVIVSGLALFVEILRPGRYTRERSGGILRRPRRRPDPQVNLGPVPDIEAQGGERGPGRDGDHAEARDIEQTLEISQLLSTILSSMTEGLVILDGAGKTVVMNDTFRRFLDLSDEPDVMDLDFQSLLGKIAHRGDLGPGDPTIAAETFFAQLREVAQNQQPAFEWDLPDGRACLVSGDIMADGGLLATFTEITEQRNTLRVMSQARDAAERGNRAKTEFLTRMSHELRTPLNSIIGFAGMLRDEALGPIGVEEYRGFANDIGASGQVLLSRINAVLDVARLEAGTLKLTEAIIDPSAVLEAAIADARPGVAASGIGFHHFIAPDLPALRADEARLRQILDHLLDNALKFSQTGGEITVRALTDPFEGIAIHVSDQGIGMTDEQVSGAFEPFGQADTALNRQYEGTGLGLALVKGLVDLHGGRITIASVPDRGTTITVILPPERMVLDL